MILRKLSSVYLRLLKIKQNKRIEDNVMGKIRFRVSSKHFDIMNDVCSRFGFDKKSMFTMMLMLERKDYLGALKMKKYDNSKEMEIVLNLPDKTITVFNELCEKNKTFKVQCFLNLLYKYSHLDWSE